MGALTYGPPRSDKVRLLLSRRILGYATLAAAGLVAVVYFGCGFGQSENPDHITVDGIVVHSPQLKVGAVEVRATVREGYTDWACFFECHEKKGCYAELKLLIEYVSQGEDQQLKMADKVEAEKGERVFIGRTQRPPDSMERVNRVVFEVVRTWRPGDPEPRPDA